MYPRALWGGSRLGSLIYGSSEGMSSDRITIFITCISSKDGTVRLIDGTAMGKDVRVSRLQSIADGRAVLSS